MEQEQPTFQYNKAEADLQIIKMKSLGIDTENQFFEQMVNHAIYMAGGMKVEQTIENEENELWNEVGAMFHGSNSFSCYPDFLQRIKKQFTITRK